MKKWLTIFCFACVVLLAACQDQQEILNGYILEHKDHHILLSFNEENDANKASLILLKLEGGIYNEQGKKLDASQLRVGHEVKVWRSGSVEESFPAKSVARKVELLNSTQEDEILAVVKTVELLRNEDKHRLFHIKSVGPAGNNEENVQVTINEFESPTHLSEEKVFTFKKEELGR